MPDPALVAFASLGWLRAPLGGFVRLAPGVVKRDKVARPELGRRRDETLPVAMGYKLAAQIPLVELVVVPDCKHPVHIEYPALGADMIRRFTAVEEPLDLDLSLPAHGQRNNGGGQTENLAMMPAAE